MVSIARKNLFEDLPRFMVAQAGIMFAVGLVTIQTGLLEGFTRSSSLLIDNADADMWIASQDLRYFDLTLPIRYEYLASTRKVAGVDRAEAVISRGALWQQGKRLTNIRVLGIESNSSLLTPWARDTRNSNGLRLQQGNLSDLKRPYTLFVDQSDLSNLKDNAIDTHARIGIGDTAKVNSYTITVRGITQGVRSIVSGPFTFTSLENASVIQTSLSAFPNGKAPKTPPALRAEDPILSFILVKAKPGENIAALKARLASDLKDLPDEIRILTQQEMSQLTQSYWRKSTGVGFILGMGAIVGVVVGMVVVGQILYSSVSDHLKEFGTLKAMGASDWYIYRIIIEQALWMAVLGYLPGMGICLGLGAWTMQTRAIQILISPQAAVAVLGMTIVMCSGAAMFAIRKVTHLDPAIVFKS